MNNDIMTEHQVMLPLYEYLKVFGEEQNYYLFPAYHLICSHMIFSFFFLNSLVKGHCFQTLEEIKEIQS